MGKMSQVRRRPAGRQYAHHGTPELSVGEVLVPANRLGLRRVQQGRPTERGSDITQARLAFMQAEYQAIRAARIAAVSAQHSILTYGLAATAAIFAGLLTAWHDLGLRIGILSLAPIILICMWFIFYGEVLRLMRASWFTWELEKKINGALRDTTAPSGGSCLEPADVLHWERWARGGNRWARDLHSRLTHYIASGILCGTALASTVLALFFGLPAAGGIRVLALCASSIFAALLATGMTMVIRNPMLRETQ